MTDSMVRMTQSAFHELKTAALKCDGYHSENKKLNRAMEELTAKLGSMLVPKTMIVGIEEPTAATAVRIQNGIAQQQVVELLKENENLEHTNKSLQLAVDRWTKAAKVAKGNIEDMKAEKILDDAVVKQMLSVRNKKIDEHNAGVDYGIEDRRRLNAEVSDLKEENKRMRGRVERYEQHDTDLQKQLKGVVNERNSIAHNLTAMTERAERAEHLALDNADKFQFENETSNNLATAIADRNDTINKLSQVNRSQLEEIKATQLKLSEVETILFHAKTDADDALAKFGYSENLNAVLSAELEQNKEALAATSRALTKAIDIKNGYLDEATNLKRNWDDREEQHKDALAESENKRITLHAKMNKQKTELLERIGLATGILESETKAKHFKAAMTHLEVHGITLIKP